MGSRGHEPGKDGLELNYFICTLGQAAHASKDSPYTTVRSLIDQQARTHHDLPAVGFYRTLRNRDGSSLRPVVLTFGQVLHGVLKTAELLYRYIEPAQAKTVGLLSASSPEFFFTWLACIQLGVAVLLIAPECPPSGVASLCHDCHVKVLLVDDRNRKLADQASQEAGAGQLIVRDLPIDGDNVFDVTSEPLTETVPLSSITDSDIAYLHHTSGTSSGRPKPIPQTHRGSVGVLPRLDGKDHATFTTTPLYHGGPADIFRAWTSNAMIWLFPNKGLPITATNIVKCLDCASTAAKDSQLPPISYFATVPYILQSLVLDTPSMKRLQSMDLVSVGGAALPQETGDALVNAGVKLVSRFGSAECGFLLSSHRLYEIDKEWQYLRLDSRNCQLAFEPRDGGLSELVVLPDWPHMAKRNRDDGSYASADLFAPHPKLKNAWRYHSRADAQLTLVTGKKFDPSPLEDGLVASLKTVIDGAFVFGDGRPYPGILLFRSEQAKSMSDDEILAEVGPVLDRIGKSGSKYANIPRSMVIPMTYSQTSLEKSSKGTILRRQAQERYAHVIETAYSGDDGLPAERCSDEELSGAITRIVEQALPDSAGLSTTSDLFSLGIDSMAGIRIRNQLQRLLPPETARLPTNIVEDCGTIEAIANFLTDVRAGKDPEATESDEDLMLSLSKKYEVASGSAPPSYVDTETVLLTGCTGSLGSHMLNLLASHDKVKHIYALVRADSVSSAEKRVTSALESRHLAPFPPKKVTVLPSNLSDPHLGLDSSLYTTLQSTITTTIHLAWNVNFRLHLRHFEQSSILPLSNLLSLSPSSRIAFCSSTASISSSPTNPAPEIPSTNPSDAGTIGYSQSKWVAEQLCATIPGSSIWRVGQLAGDVQYGVWNKSEAWPMLLSSVKVTGCLPELRGEVLDWLPVDVAARGMVEGVIDGRVEGVFHVVNGNAGPGWGRMLEWLGKRVDFEVVGVREWVGRMEEVERGGVKHSAFQLLDFWRSVFGDGEGEGKGKERKRFATDKTERAVTSLREVKEVDEEYFAKLWEWIDENVG